MIQIKNLNKYFNRNKKNELHVLDNINLEFDSTGLVCILGESGSGKTTLLNTVGGLDVFQGGSISVADITLKKYQPAKIEKLRSEKFGYIFQNYYLLQDYTVAYNVKLALNRYDLTEEEKDERVTYVLEQLGIARYKKKLVSKLSGGQQQRVSIARALVKSPQIILADEPTGNLDEENTIRIMSILRNISKECLVIVVTHEKRIAKFFADRIIDIKDGKIISDRINNSEETYSRADDGNIYLPEMEEVLLEGEDSRIQLYREPDAKEETIRLKLAWKDGKLYIHSDMDCDVMFAGEESGCEIIDDERPELDIQDLDNFSYHLEKLPAKKSANLPLREVWRMAIENLQLLGKKQTFVIAIMLVTVVLLTLTTADYITMASIHTEDIVQDDSHYIEVEMVPSARHYPDKIREERGKFFNKVLNKDNRGEMLFADIDRNVSIRYDDFFQMRGLDVQIKDFSYVNISHLKEEDVVYGRMPVKRDEIVVDSLLLNRFLKSGVPLADRYESIKDFLNQKLVVNVYEKELTIVGISEMDEASIYCFQNILYGMAQRGNEIATIEQLQQIYPDQFGDITLEKDEILVKDTEYSRLDKVLDSRNEKGELVTKDIGGSTEVYSDGEEEENATVYRVVGSIPDDLGFDYIVSEGGSFAILRRTIVNSRKCKLYVEQPEDRQKLVREIRKEGKEFSDYFEVKVTIPYEDQINDFKTARQGKIDKKRIFVFLVVVVSLLMIYYTIKSNVFARMEELTVYRLIGIGKRSIMKAYLLEMILINCYTSLPALILTTFVLHVAASVPSLGISLTFPWWGAAVLLAVIYVVSCVISMLPVNNILSKPPAELAVKQ